VVPNVGLLRSALEFSHMSCIGFFLFFFFFFLLKWSRMSPVPNWNSIELVIMGSKVLEWNVLLFLNTHGFTIG
jgi:hypothetical protein